MSYRRNNIPTGDRWLQAVSTHGAPLVVPGGCCEASTMTGNNTVPAGLTSRSYTNNKEREVLSRGRFDSDICFYFVFATVPTRRERHDGRKTQLLVGHPLLLLLLLLLVDGA